MKNVYIVEFKKELMIVPVPEDPMAELQELGKSLPNKSLAEFKQVIEEEALTEVFKKRSKNYSS